MLLSTGQPVRDDYSRSTHRTACAPAARATLTRGAEHDSSTGWGSRYQSADGALCIVGQSTINISVREGRNYSLAGDHTIPFLSLLDFLYQVINKLFVLVVSSQREDGAQTITFRFVVRKIHKKAT